MGTEGWQHRVMIRIDSRSLTVFCAALGTSLVCAGVLFIMDSPGFGARLAGQPLPLAAPAVLRAADGHYWADASVDDRPVRMLVDTGASLVTLSRKDARLLGIYVTDDEFTQTLSTAAGPVMASPVTLKSLSVAGIRLTRVEAMVVDRDLPAPLLGMSFLGRLSAFEARPDGIVLKS